MTEFKQIYDVIVVGGGPAGIMSAMAASKLGASTLVIEKNGFLGGMATAACVGPISPFHYKDEQVINGIPQDFVDRLVAEKGSTGHMKTLDPYGSGDSLCFYDHEKYKYVAAEMLLEFGAHILYHAVIESVDVENNRVTGLTAMYKDGSKKHFKAHVIVDATGDGDIAVRAGENYTYGDPVTHKFSPGSGMFEMCNVDMEKTFRYVQENMDDFEFKSDCVPMREYDASLDQHYFVVQGFKKLVAEAVAAGDLNFGRDSVIILNGIHPGQVHFNATRVFGYKSTDMAQETDAEIDARRQIESVSEFMIKYVPGFENAFVTQTGAEVGVRESRHIEGCYTITGQDAYEGRKHADVVSRGYFPIDLHNPDGKAGYGNGGTWMVLKDTFDIPYRSLVPKHIDGLILSGRCISGTNEAAGSYRTQGGIMGIGQAAGVAAAVCAKNKVQPREQDVKEIQETLIRLGASVFRDEEKTKAEKANARKRSQDYIKACAGHLITDPAILKEYED